MIIIRRLFLLLLIISVALVANADGDKSFKCEGNTYISSTGRVKASTELVPSRFNWTDSKGVNYPIYISNSGSCFIIKTSAKTNKEYRCYLKPDVSQDICKKLGREYKSKKK